MPYTFDRRCNASLCAPAMCSNRCKHQLFEFKSVIFRSHIATFRGVDGIIREDLNFIAPYVS